MGDFGLGTSKPSYWSPAPYFKRDTKPKRKRPRIDYSNKPDKPILSRGNAPAAEKTLHIDHPGDIGGLVLQIHHDPDAMAGAKVVVGRVLPHIQPPPPTQGYPRGIPT